jgi:hypothetical protein
LVTTTSGQLTEIVVAGEEVPLPSLPVVNEAVFEIVPQVAAVVADVMCTCLEALDPMLPKPHDSDWEPSAPEIVHPVSEPGASMTQ